MSGIRILSILTPKRFDVPNHFRIQYILAKLLCAQYMLVLVILLGIVACEPPTPVENTIADHELANAWSAMTLYITKHTPANSPTYASRAVGYIGLCMYESIVPGYASHQSLEGQLNGLTGLPKADPEVEYFWPLSFNAGQAQLLRHIYNQTSDENKFSLDSLENSFEEIYQAVVADRAVVARSKAFGQQVADAIFAWSKTDGGHRAYLRNFDKELVHPVRPGAWKPPLYAQSFSHHPLHPYWGENRTFLKENSNLELPYMIPYDTTKGSPYYEQFKAVYDKDLTLTQKEKEIAIWWGDDPDETFTPPGHSFYIASLVIEKKQPDLITCAETYARVGIAVADAFINCWKWKYHFFSERPNTFIPEYIDPEWESFWPDPPFPAFPSGHAIQAAAMATALEGMYGPDFSFVDKAHVGRERDELRDVDFVERPFSSFWGVAEETADSRFFGGIHTPQDNEIGLVEGKRIAGHVNNLNWRQEN